jgi:Ras family
LKRGIIIIPIYNNREVSTQDGAKYAEQMKAIFFEVSAKTGENIDKLFNGLVYQLVGGTVIPTPQPNTSEYTDTTPSNNEILK